MEFQAGAIKSKPAATETKLSATKSKSGETKSKSDLLPLIEVYQWVIAGFGYLISALPS
jgi:hypothetical protein